MIKETRFFDPALETVYRVLGLCDRLDGSETLGCCDRAHWHYRTADMTNARAQEAGLLLALAYSAPASDNPFHANAAIRDWIRDIWRFWLSRRNGDGSASEVYPFERSFCATSFTAAAFVETVSLMGGSDAWTAELGQAKKTMGWLSRNSSPDTGNQQAASYLALRGYANLTDDDTMGALADRRREALLDMQWADGVFPEYGGLDTGYQTITLGILARAMAHDADPRLRQALEKGEGAIRGRIGPDGRHDAAANSRSTQFTYPYGLAVLGSPSLKGVARGLDDNVILRPAWMDDRYCVPLAIDYFWTHRELNHADDAS